MTNPRRPSTIWVALSAGESLGCGRLDLAHGYNNDAAVARAIADSGVPRSELFILSKISLGHADALLQISNILRDLETDYVDALLIHWPRRGGTGLDPLCNPPVDERACRISTWRAMLEIFHRGSARSIGVSNYYPEHFAVRASSKLNASSQSTGRQAKLGEFSSTDLQDSLGVSVCCAGRAGDHRGGTIAPRAQPVPVSPLPFILAGRS